jgi:protein-tyrosine phosphatase
VGLYNSVIIIFTIYLCISYLNIHYYAKKNVRLNLKSGLPNYFETTKKIKYKRIDVSDDATTDLLSYADSIVAFVSSGLHHGSVLVHCRQGVSRSPTCVAFFLIRKCGMTLDRAMSTMKSRRPDVSPIPAFMDQLTKYEAQCQKLGVIQPLTGQKETTLIGPARPTRSSDEHNEEKEKRPMIGPSMPTIPSSIVPERPSPEACRKAPSVIGPLTSEACVNRENSESSVEVEDPPRKRSRIDNL